MILTIDRSPRLRMAGLQMEPFMQLMAMQNFDRSIYGIGITTDLDLDGFCNFWHWDFRLFYVSVQR
jgi:hypothetical protein